MNTVQSQQVVTLNLFRFSNILTRSWAFMQMGLSPLLMQNIDGLQFRKLMNAGADSGFGIMPDFDVYTLLCVWENEAKAEAFFSHHKSYLRFSSRTSESYTFYMHTLSANGFWHKKQPFLPNSIQNYSTESPMIILTRATVKWKLLRTFWREVPKASSQVQKKYGAVMALGVGELPVIEPVTFSLWANKAAMMKYAYESTEHKEVIAKTRQLNWYKEELFARFVPYRGEGTWEGKSLLQFEG